MSQATMMPFVSEAVEPELEDDGEPYVPGRRLIHVTLVLGMLVFAAGVAFTSLVYAAP